MSRARAVVEIELTEQLERLLQRSTAIHALVEQRPRALDAQARMLLRLIDRHGPLRSSELAERIGLSRPSVSRYLAALGEAGLVAASADPSDGRAALLTLTAAGGRRLEGIDAAWQQAVQRITDDFTYQDVTALATLLARFNDNAAAVDTPAEPARENSLR